MNQISSLMIFFISDHFTFVLKCKQGCQGQLNRIGDEVIENMFPFMYFYMMFAYYKGKFDLNPNWPCNEIYIHKGSANYE